MRQFKVVKNFSESRPGDLVFLNDRRAKSELANGNVIEIKEEKPKIKTKEEKIVKATKKPRAKTAKK
jgi:hypothetical protein